MKIFKSIITLFCILIWCVNTQAQSISKKAKEYQNRAIMSYHNHDYASTERFAKKAIEEASDWVEPYALLGDLYRYQKKYQLGINLFQDYQKIKPEYFGSYLNIADFYALMEKYGDAAMSLNQMLQLQDVPDVRRQFAEKRMIELKELQRMVDNPVPFHPENVGSGINSNRDEYLPAMTVDNENMFFTRRKVLDSFTHFRDDAYYYRYNEDLMLSKWDGNKWTEAIDIPGQVNTKDNEGGMAVAPDGSFLIFTGCERPDGLGSCDLFISFFMEGKWTKPVNMGAPINTRFKETQPSISFDGRSVYFSSNRKGSLGGLDIWVSTRDDNWNFSEPVNLGSSINTTEDDQTPFIHPDNQTLYFCSRGHINFGQNDIFFSRRISDTTWGNATNIGYPINTPQDEPGLIVDRKGTYAYYTSSRKGGYGGLDIYRFELPVAAKPKFITYLKGTVADAYTKAPLKAYFELTDLETGKTLNAANTGKDGEFLIALPGGKDYMLNVSSKGYLFYSENIPLKDYKVSEPYRQQVALYPIKAGEKISLRNIFFDSDSYKLEDKSRSELSKLVDFMKQNPNLKIEISGHTDNSGTPAHNKSLSENRAKAVYDYLIKAGIPAARLSFKGYGETQPLAPNTTEEGKALNRRTEVKITSL